VRASLPAVAGGLLTHRGVLFGSPQFILEKAKLVDEDGQELQSDADE
jgi:hypothetical protein